MKKFIRGTAWTVTGLSVLFIGALVWHGHTRAPAYSPNLAGEVNGLYAVCEELDKTALLSEPCSVDGNVIRITADITSSEARGVCSAFRKVAIKYKRAWTWAMEVRSPYAKGPLATCSVAGGN